MSRDWKLYWQDIIASCEKVRRFTSGMDQTAFVADERTYDAVLRNIEIIGEAAKNLPPEARALAPDIAWRKIAATRDIVAHAYFGIDNDTLWDIIDSKVPELLKAMRGVKLP